MAAWLAALFSLLTVHTHAQVAGPMDIWPQNNTVEIGTTKSFGAYVPINPNTVIWLVNGKQGGDTNVGTISATGLYTAPAVAPTNNVLTIRAQSTAFPSSFAATTLTVTRPYPWSWSVAPTSLQVGSYSVTFNGSGYAPDSVVQANGVDLPTTYFSKTKVAATGVAAAAGTINFAVRQPGPGAVTGNSVSATVTAVTITVTVAPTSASVQLGNSQAFTATVAGNANKSVTWSVVGGAANGSITASGVYTAPAAMPASPTVTVQAASVANSSVIATAKVTLTTPPVVTVAVAPTSATVLLGATKSFSATVTGSANTAVTWSVVGGAANGAVTSAGIYTAPAALPSPATVIVRATSVANALSYADATVTLQAPPVIVAVSPPTATVQIGNSKTFSASVSGSANKTVTWSVVGGSVNGTIDSTGLYVTPPAMPASPTVTVRATSVADPTSSATAVVTLTPPPDYTALLAAARLLEQTSFGPNDASLAQVQALGVDAYLAQQFALPATPIPVPADNSVGTLQQWQLNMFCTAPDQLRQRVIYALSQIIVVSADKNIYADAMLPWMNALSANAFGNYKNLLRDISKSSSMGKYLDLANSTKPGVGSGANENYARELMQLFSLGLWQLNQDGTQVLGADGQPIPTYDQSTIAQVARVLTGWTYAQPPGGSAYEWHGAPMVPVPGNHDTTQKVVFGQTIQAGQSVAQDLESLLTILMNHPNTAPFISTRLIRSLVTSNPTPGYVKRVADVFSATGGDLQATITAIITDGEARNDAPTPTSGRLKDSILASCGFLRALNGQFNNPEGLTYIFAEMGQTPLDAPSVFSWFSPLYHIPKSPLFGPEFQIYTPYESALRGNLFFYFLNQPGPDFTVDLTPYQAFGNDMPGLVELANQKLLYGQMTPAMKQALITAAAPGYDAKTRIETVLYLTALSGYYAVQH
ncbi:MAG TPA: DUF1800 family protein [Candidatus Limnocylindria bacterium]|nr:DUF1800 family protein [Candidatus Limnocylindria bacterium]